MPLRKLRELARDVAYAPDRGIDNGDAPEPLRGEAREIPARCGGDRVYFVTDDRGEICGLGLMHPNGRREEIAAGLSAAKISATEVPLRAVS